MRNEPSLGTWDERADRFDRVIEWLLIALLVFAPFAFGAVEAWSEEIIIALAAALCVCFLLKVILVEQTPVLWTPAYIPIALFLVLVAVQCIPLPMAWARLISPNTISEKTQLLGDLHGDTGKLSAAALSFYVWGTKHDLRLVLAVVAVFVVVLNIYRRPAQIVRLLGAIAIIGAAAALLALAQDIGGNGKIYWFVPIPHGNSVSGPFVNHSHYAQFISLSIGASLGLVFMTIHRRFVQRVVTPAEVAEYLGSADARVVWGLVAIGVVGMATIFMSLSRGGMISIMFAGAFTTLVLSARKSLRGPGWIMALLALGAFVCVLYIGFDAVYERLSTLGDLQQAQGGRWQILKDIAVAWTRFPATGTGLGTHEVVYPMFDRSTIPALAAHAENEYAQAAEETGVIGLAALVALAVIVWRGYVRTIRSPRLPIHSIAYGLGFGLVAVMVHSLSDFGQHIPANAFLSAVFCALLIRLPRIQPEADVAAGEMLVSGRRARSCGTVGLAAACVVWGWALLGADSARCGEAHWKKALTAERQLAEKNWQGSDAEYTYLLTHATKAQNCAPGNVKYGHWLNVHRWRAISRLTDPNTGEMILPPEGIEFAGRIADELKHTVVQCPTFGATWCVLGQLEKSILTRDEEGGRHVRIGRRLAPCDATVCFISGRLHADEGNTRAAFGDWRRAVDLDPQLFAEVSLLLIRLDQSGMAYELAEGREGRLIELAQVLEGEEGSAELLAEVENRTRDLLERECQEPDAPGWKFAWLAKKYRQEGRSEEAIRMYRQALALQYGEVGWRYSLAELLAGDGAASEAIRELNICLRLRPQFEAARRLLERLSQVNAGVVSH